MTNELTVFERLLFTVQQINCFSLLGGECDELVRFLQLEWESYTDEAPSNLKKYFYRELKEYKKCREELTQEWRKNFSNRDFDKLII